VVEKILDAIGFGEVAVNSRIFGGGDCRPKPASDVYRLTAEAFSLPAEVGLSVGDRYDFDAIPARSIGMGAVVVSGMAEFEQVVDRLLETK
jgi:FMN phosphatase YigB (HAD superfamily)